MVKVQTVHLGNRVPSRRLWTNSVGCNFTCVGRLLGAGSLLGRAAVPVQLYLQLPDQIIFGVQLQLQLVDERVSLSQLLDLQLQGQLKISEGAGALGHCSHGTKLEEEETNWVELRYRKQWNIPFLLPETFSKQQIFLCLDFNSYPVTGCFIICPTSTRTHLKSRSSGKRSQPSVLENPNWMHKRQRSSHISQHRRIHNSCCNDIDSSSDEADEQTDRQTSFGWSDAQLSLTALLQNKSPAVEGGGIKF